jgi:IS66 C-terminal element
MSRLRHCRSNYLCRSWTEQSSRATTRSPRPWTICSRIGLRSLPSSPMAAPASPTTLRNAGCAASRLVANHGSPLDHAPGMIVVCASQAPTGAANAPRSSTPPIGTAKLNNLDPQAWLADSLVRINDIPQTRLHELLPWNWGQRAELSPIKLAT